MNLPIQPFDFSCIKCKRNKFTHTQDNKYKCEHCGHEYTEDEIGTDMTMPTRRSRIFLDKDQP